MLDPRIYRRTFLVVVLAVMVLAFSLEDQQGALRTNIVPDAFNGSHASTVMKGLAEAYPDRRPGSPGDLNLAGAIARQLGTGKGGDHFQVSRSRFSAPTPDGTRTLENVVGTRAGGSSSGSIVIISHRDALGRKATASLSGTAVMLELARVLAGQTLHRTLVVASTSGSDGAAGAQRLVSEIPGPVDAVIVLGDLAGVAAPGPLVVPWSNDRQVAPTALRNTIAAALSGQTRLSAGGSGLAGQVAHMALPMSATEQAPFNAVGKPAVLLSVSGEHDPAPDEPTSTGRIAAMGRSVLEALTALQAGTAIPRSSSYLLWSGKVIPAWAVRLLVLVLILPVLAVAVDGMARARRRGHSIIRWVGWVVAAGIPFVLAALLVEFAKVTGWIGPIPTAPVSGGVWPLGAGGIALLVVMGIVLVAGVIWLRPLLIRVLGLDGPVASRGASSRRTTVDSPAAQRRALQDAAAQGAGPAVGVLLVMCLVTLAVWLANPFAALLVLVALHLWIWIVTPDLRLPWLATIPLLLIGLAPVALLAAYYAGTLNLGPVAFAWSSVLMLAGGSVSLLSAIEWSLLAGCAVSVVVIAARMLPVTVEEPPVTVRGPVSYAGPGSLGGTESALRR